MSIMKNEFIVDNDLDWYAKSNDGIAHFATGGTENIPDFFKKNKELWELICNFFDALPELEQNIIICEENLPIFSDIEERNRYLNSFVCMAKKGLYSYDIDFDDLSYKLIAYPLYANKNITKNIYDSLPYINLQKVILP